MRPENGQMRIVSDGHRFKVQQYVYPRLLPRFMAGWRDLGEYSTYGIFCPGYYDTIGEALDKLDSIKDYRAKLHKWQEVSL